MSPDLSPLLRPRSIAVFGGRWAVNLIRQLKKSGFDGAIWPVHPERKTIEGLPCVRSVADLPTAPDAGFIGVNRDSTIAVVKELAAAGCGGAICFASGFLESENPAEHGALLQQQLITAAGDMPILGPNCYGLLNYLDNIPLWPDEHGGVPVDRGVGIITQSSNIAISLSMQRRALPIAYLITVGNQARIGVADIATTLLEDNRITALGLYLESFGDIAALERLARKAYRLAKPVVVIKTGKSLAAQQAVRSHTASLAGSDTAGSALLRRLGFVEVDSLDVFLETLKLLHIAGPLADNSLTSVSCSGGEAALMADSGYDLGLRFIGFSPEQYHQLSECLGSRVSIANPLDYHTYIWGDSDLMSRCFTSVCAGRASLNVFVLDLPRADRCESSGWDCAIDAIIAAKKTTAAPVAVLASLAENIPETLAHRFSAAGCVPLFGLRTGLAAIAAAVRSGRYRHRGLKEADLLISPCSRQAAGGGVTLTEAQAKRTLAGYGLSIPQSFTAATPAELQVFADRIGYPCVLKGLGLAHKSDQGAVVLNISDREMLVSKAETMADRLGDTLQGFLIEPMVSDRIAELLVGVSRDTTGLLVLTLGAGGILTELWRETVSLLLPSSQEAIGKALQELRYSQVLAGYRGGPVADLAATLAAIRAICVCAEALADRLIELEVNPLIAGAQGAVGADALIRLYARHPAT